MKETELEAFYDKIVSGQHIHLLFPVHERTQIEQKAVPTRVTMDVGAGWIITGSYVQGQLAEMKLEKNSRPKGDRYGRD